MRAVRLRRMTSQIPPSTIIASSHVGLHSRLASMTRQTASSYALVYGYSSSEGWHSTLRCVAPSFFLFCSGFELDSIASVEFNRGIHFLCHMPLGTFIDMGQRHGIQILSPSNTCNFFLSISSVICTFSLHAQTRARTHTYTHREREKGREGGRRQYYIGLET